MKLGIAGGRTGHAHDQRQVADEAVADPEDHRPQGPRTAAAVPSLSLADLGGASRRSRDRDPVTTGLRVAGEPSAGLQAVPDLGVLPFVGRDRRDLR